MPKVDGLEVLAQIKADSKLQSIPVCMLTTSADVADIDKAYALGANSYVTKPVSFKDFMAKVEKIGKFWLETNLLPTMLRPKEATL